MAVHRPAQRFIAWLGVSGWAGVIFIASSRPGNTLPGGYALQAHLGEYFILGALLMWALHGDSVTYSTVGLAIVLASLYGVSDEVHQHFVVMRTPDVIDWLVDTVGAALGALFIRYLLTRSWRGGSSGEDSSG